MLVGSDRPELLALVEAGRLSALRAAATSAVAARLLSRPGTRALGLIGCGRLAAAHVECLRVALPGLDRVVAYCRTPSRLAAFCERTGAEPAEYGRDAAEQEIVVTATSSRDPVLRGDWLRPGACVLATGATRREDRELDNAVLARASFVCCDSLAQARLEAGDLAEPVERGVLDWLEVHELAGVVGGTVQPRGRDDDVVLYKSRERRLPTPRWPRSCWSARWPREAGYSDWPARAVSSPIARIRSGRSSSRRRSRSLARLRMYGSSRMSSRSRPSLCSRIT